MKILMINTSDLYGGAARAAYRLNSALNNAGADSKMLVKRKDCLDDDVIEINKKEKLLGLLGAEIDLIPLRFYKKRKEGAWSTAMFSSGLSRKINKIDCDVVHLHWFYSGFVSISDLLKIKKPIVWTFHDSWPFTGGCHIPYECKKYEKACGDCPILNSGKKNDLSSRTINKKEEKWKNLNLSIVSPSKWLADCASKSNLFKGKKINVIPNGIDTKVFKPIEKKIAREILNLPFNKKYILFGAMNALVDKNKGVSLLRESLEILRDKCGTEVEVLIFGSSKKPKKPIPSSIKVRYLGKLNDDVALSVLYSSADVTVVPSIQENFSNTILESLSSGTPVVAFDVGGNVDLIEHKNNGYLAEYKSSKDLSEGIRWVLDNDNYEELCQNARKKVIENFDAKIIVEKYSRLYEKVLENKDDD